MKSIRPLIENYFNWILQPISPRSLGLFRIWFGMICLINLILIWPDLDMWLGANGVVPDSVHAMRVGGLRFSLYSIFGRTDVVIALIRILSLIGSFSLIFGVASRFGALLLWLATVSISWRNPDILNSGDTLMRLVLFFLMFARSDAALSLTNWWRMRSQKTQGAEDSLIPAWPIRVLQLQLCLVYLVTAIWKSKGVAWNDGSAVGIVLQLGDFQRFPIPDLLMTDTASKLLSWSTLGIEFLFPFLIWSPRLRIPTLIVGLGLHVGLEWVMNVQLFQWTITSLYILFLTPNLQGLQTAVTWFQEKLQIFSKSHAMSHSDSYASKAAQ